MGKFLIYALIGAAAGVLGGMGMGGGTILIPLLTLFSGVGQHEAQAANLAAFIPMAAVSLFIHIKHKRVEKKGLPLIIIPAAVFSVAGGLAASAVGGDVLRRIFGGFLLALAVFQFFTAKKSESEE